MTILCATYFLLLSLLAIAAESSNSKHQAVVQILTRSKLFGHKIEKTEPFQCTNRAAHVVQFGQDRFAGDAQRSASSFGSLVTQRADQGANQDLTNAVTDFCLKGLNNSTALSFVCQDQDFRSRISNFEEKYGHSDGVFGTVEDILSAATTFSSLRQLLNGRPDFGKDSKIKAIMDHFSRFDGCRVITNGHDNTSRSVIAFMRKGMVPNIDDAHALSKLCMNHNHKTNPREILDCAKEGCTKAKNGASNYCGQHIPKVSSLLCFLSI